MPKGIAVDQLILLILGIIVLAVIGYLIYVNFISSNSSFDSAKCQARALSVCTACKVAAKTVSTCKFPDAANDPDKWVIKCGGGTNGGACNFPSANTCTEGGPIDCKSLGIDLGS
jgi:hypothetical protein